MSDNKLFRSTDNGNIEDVINKDRTAEKVAKRKEDVNAENIEKCLSCLSAVWKALPSLCD